MALITSTFERIPGPTIRIHCPVCNARSVPAETMEQIDHLKLAYLIPLFRVRNTFVKCTACGKQSISKISLNELARYSADDLSPHLAGRVWFVSKFLAVMSVLLFWVPIVGLILGIGGALTNLRSTGWSRTVSLVGVGLSVLGTIGFFILLAMGV